MPRRNQWKKNSVGHNKNSVGRDKNSVGHDKIAGVPLRHFIAWYARKILYHATRRRMVQNFSSEPWNNLNKQKIRTPQSLEIFINYRAINII
jgi:hypothetical protein